MSLKLSVRRLLARPGLNVVRHDLNLGIRDGRITAIEAGGGAALDLLAVPAPVNAHDHGYGVRTLAFGGSATRSSRGSRACACGRASTFLECLVAFARLAKADIGATMHCHNSLHADQLVEEVAGVVRAAREVGIRLGLSCPILDCNAWVYGGPEALRPLAKRTGKRSRPQSRATRRPRSSSHGWTQ